MQSLTNAVKDLTAYQAQLVAMADVEAKTLAAKTELAAVRSQLAGIKDATTGMSLAQYKVLKDLDERIFVARKRLEELELAIPKAQATLNSYGAANAETKHRHDQIEDNILQFRAKIKGSAA